MRYEINTKADQLSGATLVVRFPEEDVDEKALYTIQNSRPEFLVPFTYRLIDGKVECEYILESRSKLQYRFGDKTPTEYINLWEKLLNPLLECGDWFLKPFSFVLDVGYLYSDKAGKEIYFLYIPSKNDCVEAKDLQELAAKLVNLNRVADQNLENKTLRLIMQDFQPTELLRMLRGYSAGKTSTTRNGASTKAAAEGVRQTVKEENQSPNSTGQVAESPKSVGEYPKQHVGADDDIVINLLDEKHKKKSKDSKKADKQQPSQKKSGGLFGFGKGKQEKQEKQAGIFSRDTAKKVESQGIIAGAAAEARQVAPFPNGSVVFPQAGSIDEITQIDSFGTRLRRVGDVSLPAEIEVTIEQGQSFTIGRFDISVGRKQWNFEFAKDTKAVSRPHAAIERGDDGQYAIVDLSSRAGTFLDGVRIQPGVLTPLRSGMRVSFGTAGADYIWEE